VQERDVHDWLRWSFFDDEMWKGWERSMSLAGKLEDLRVPELLQVLALAGKTGKLALSRPDGFGLVVLRRGKIIYAVCNGVRETFGHILVCRGLIDEKTLAKALEKQYRSRTEQRLGAILVSMGALDAATVESVISEQTAKVIRELVTWPGGFFRFDSAEIPDLGEVEVDARDFLMNEGIDGEKAALDVLVTLGEDEEASVAPPGRPARGAAAAMRAVPDSAPTATLGTLLGDVRTPAFTGEETRAFMSAAARVVNRGVIFAVRRRDVVGMAQFGLGGDAEPPDSRVRRLLIPLSERSVLATAVTTGATYRGPLEDTPWNRRLWQQLGGGRQPEVVVVPITAGGAVVAVFYGDNAPAGDRVTRVRELEILALETGTAADGAFRHRPPAAAPR
jgi:hypothetical protein